MFQLNWWKYACIILLYYTIVAGFLMPAPELDILHESIRNLYFHVPMWFGMTFLLLVSLIFSLRYLIYHKIEDDFKAASAAQVGLLFGICGIVTGMQWARVTWGAWWNNDPKQTDAAIALLIYFAYFVLRSSMDDIDKRARVSAVANVMFYAIFIPLIFIVPRLTDSLHPGSGGNPGFNAYDLDGRMRLVFYPAVIAWSLLGFWIAEVGYRTTRAGYNLKLKQMN
jgi:heme exporter protein C